MQLVNFFLSFLTLYNIRVIIYCNRMGIYMNNVQIYTLFSSSSGNCHYIRLGDKELLVDAGRNAKAVKGALESIGTDISRISHVCITHEHSDHVSALRVLQKSNSAMTLHYHPLCEEALVSSGIDLSCSAHISAGESICDGTIHIEAFEVCHDSAACLGYRIEYENEGAAFKIGIATDIGHLTREVAEGLCGCDCVIVESNHDQAMLRTGPYPEYLKARIFSSDGHLPNESCAKLCSYLSRLGTSHVMLAHLSKENNDPALALRLTREAIANDAVTVLCASPSEPVCLYNSKLQQASEYSQIL